MYSVFDVNRDGCINYNEFLKTIRGELNDFRRQLVEKAFIKLDRDGSGVVETNDLLNLYNSRKHPAVLDGRKTEE